MCEFEKRLIAWMDCELEAGEALEIERHLRVCAACSARAGEYRDVSRSFADYCGAIATRKDSRRFRWAAWGATAAAAIAAGMVMLMLHPRVEPLPFQSPAVAQAPAMAFRTTPVNLAAPVRLIHRRPTAKRGEIPQRTWRMGPSIEIAIPVEAVFAPGAMPRGFSFAAELSIANDGSPGALLLRP
jgi:hypothetical protein